MRIESLSVKIPSKKITNNSIYEYIEEYNKDLSYIKKKTYLRIIKTLLKKSGSQVRYIRDKENNEKAVDLIKASMEEALEKANMSKEDIDLLIYCGVGKGFLEPASSYFYAKTLGINPSCFDICDACMSWIRALEIAHNFLKTGQYKNVMVINGEFNAYDHGFPENFKIKNIRQAEYTFPTYTIGEAASTTILTASDQEWQFNFLSKPELADLCTIALDGYQDYVEPNEKHGLNGIYKFVSFGADMFSNAENFLGELVIKCIKDRLEPNIYFPHAASSNAYLMQVDNVGIPKEKMFAEVFPTYGNLVSASIPAGMDLAIKQKKLNRGDRVVFCPASAGMVFAVVQFNY